jgi:hypothetical protein
MRYLKRRLQSQAPNRTTMERQPSRRSYTKYTLALTTKKCHRHGNKHGKAALTCILHMSIGYGERMDDSIEGLVLKHFPVVDERVGSRSA